MLGPDPAAGTQDHAVGIERLKLHGHVCRQLDVEGAVRLHRNLAQQALLDHREGAVDRGARSVETRDGAAGLVSPRIIDRHWYAFNHPQTPDYPRRHVLNDVRVRQIDIEAIQLARGVLLVDHAGASVRLRTRGQELGVYVVEPGIVEDRVPPARPGIEPVDGVAGVAISRTGGDQDGPVRQG